MSDRPPPTLRSGLTCPGCVRLRHQLELADLLAAQFAPLIEDIKTMAANSKEPMCEKDATLVAAFDLYSAARVTSESEANPETVEEDVERRR